MNRVEIALENHKKGYNCAQSVLCAFADKTGFTEDQLFKLSEAFGAGMGNTKGVCGAVSAMMFLVGLEKSAGAEKIPETNKKQSYALASELYEAFEKKNNTVICRELKAKENFSCEGYIEDSVKILEEIIFNR